MAAGWQSSRLVRPLLEVPMFDWLLYLVRSLFLPPVGEDELTTTEAQDTEIEIPDPEPNAGGAMISGG